MRTLIVLQQCRYTYQVLGLDGDTLSVDGGQVGVLEEGDEVGLSSLLKGHHSGGLETKIRLHTCSSVAFPNAATMH